MKKSSKILYYFLQFTWGIIQNFIGLLVWLLLMIINPKRLTEKFAFAPVTHWKFSFSMGLGMFIFYGHGDTPEKESVLVHEYGHTLQSAVLGPMFLPVIAIPSTTWAFLPLFVKWRKEGKYRYIDLYCEAWANCWGEAATGLKAIIK